MSEPAIAIVPFGAWKPFGMARAGLNELHWPLGQPERLQGGTIADLTADDHLLVFASSKLFLLPWLRIRSKLSVLIVEPDALHAKNLKRARFWNKSFFAILTKSKPALATLPNGMFYYFGSTFIDDIAAIDPTKSKHVSLIASGKRDLPGHQMRHRIVEYCQEQNLDVDVMGRGYKPFASKADGLQSYRFSVVIENTRENDYVTEKIVDAMLCRTVPVYWGCPNIEDYFAVDGMIICESEEDLRRQISSLKPQDYANRLEAIEENYRRALDHADYLTRAAILVRDRIRKS